MNPVLWAGLSFAAGCALGLERWLFWQVWAALWGLSLVLLGAAAWKTVQRQKMLALCCLFFLFSGALSGAVRQSAAENMAPLAGKTVSLTGRMVPGSFQTGNFGSASFLLAEPRGHIRVQVKKWENGPLPLGKIRVKGKFSPPGGFYNPGQMLPERRAAVQRLGGILAADPRHVTMLSTEKNGEEMIFTAGETLRQQVKHAMAPKDSGLLLGMLLGESGGVEGETLRLFQKLGLSHLLSVSGSHVALLLGLLTGLFQKLPVPKKIGTLGILLLLFCYILLCGAKASICRAGLLGAGVLLGNLNRKKADGTAFLGAALLLLLAWHPFWVWDAGFQLSFSAALGLMTLQKPVRDKLALCLPKFAAAGLSMPLSAQLFSLPFLVQHFHSLSFVSLPANFFLVPVLSLVLSLTALGSTLGALGLALFSRLVLLPAAQLTGVSLWGGELLAKLPGTAWITGSVSFFLWPLYFLLLFAVLEKGWFQNCGKNFRRSAFFLSGAALIFLLALPHFQKKTFTVYFLDVGQGDCALVCTPEGGHILMDTGGLLGNYDVGERILVPVLRSLGADKVDAVFLSHGHHDHAGGLKGLVRWIPVEKLYLPRETPSQDIEYAIGKGKEMETVKFVYKIQTNQKVFSKGSIISIVEAPEETKKGGSSNETSAIVRVEAGGRSILFTGDAPAEGERLAAAKNIRSDVLKVSHHGSKTSSDWEFLQAVRPALAVISAGRNNRFGHPHRETLDKLAALAIPTARTDQQGAICVQLDQTGIFWKGFRPGNFAKEQAYE